MLKKVPADKINVAKNALCFLSRAFNSRLLYELKHKVDLSKIVPEIFYFRSGINFIKVYIFVQQKAWTL